MPIVIGLGDTAWNDPLNIFGGKPAAPEPGKAAAPSAPRRFTLTDQDRQDLRKTIAAEAAGEGENGMIAVGNVIRNRAERRGKSLADIVREPDQFTGYAQPGAGALQILQDPDQVAKIDGIIDRMAAGELPDITGEADHYHAKSVNPDWASRMPKTAEVGQHLFYRAETGPDTKKRVPSYDELAGQIGLDGDPFAAVLRGDASPADQRKPKGRGIADLLPDDSVQQTQESASVLLSKLQAGKPPEYIANMKPALQTGLVRMFEEAPDFVRDGLDILSGARSPERQAQIIAENAGKYGFDREAWLADVEKLGPVDAGKKWRPQFREIGLTQNIGMPGTSKHQEGVAADLGWKGGKFAQAPKEVREWVHANAANYDLAFPLGHEPWHIETAGARSGAIEENPAPNRKPAQATAAAGGKTIVIDESFAASDPMGLMGGSNPFAGIADEAKAAREAEQTQVADQFEQNRIRAYNEANNNRVEAQGAQLDAEAPGRYVEIPEAELPQFQQKWEEENRSGGVMGDTGRILKSGTIGLGQSLKSLSDVVFSNLPGGKALMQASDDIDRWFMGETLDQRLDKAKAQTNASVTPEQAEADVKNWWDSERGWFGPAWRDPRSYLRTVGESVPSTVVTMAPGGIMARGAFLRTMAATGSERAAAAAAAKTATLAGAVLEGTLGGADAARNVQDRIAALPREQLLQTETVQALIAGGMSEDEAITALSDDAATKSFAIAGVATGMFGGMGDRALAKILAEGVGGSVAKRMVSGAVRGAVAEGLLEEAPQGAAQTIAENMGVRDANPDQSLTEGVGEAVASGIAAGGAMGGGMGAAGGAISPARETANVDEPQVPEGYRRVAPDGSLEPAPAEQTPPAPAPRGPIGRSVRHAEEQIAQRQSAAPAPVIGAAAPAVDGKPAVGATVTVSADGIEPFMGTVQGYEGEEAIVSTGDGELFQMPVGNLTVNAAPVARVPDPGPQPINDAIPEFSNDPALEPLPPTGAEVRSEGLPPRSEQKEATERFPSAPTAGQRVIVDDENGGRFVATVQGYENGATEALLRTDDGKDLQVPVSSLKVSKLTEKQVEAQDLERNPPIEREVGDAGPMSRTVLGKTIVLPDEKHARLFDLGKERTSAKRLMGTSALDMDKVDPRELKALAKEFGVSEQGVGLMAEDYMTRMVRNARSANSKLPQRMPPVMDNILARWRRETVDADTSPAADETQAWYDRELDDEGRRLAMISANIKRPPKTPWADLSPAMRKKLATVRQEQLAAAAVDSTEGNSVESDVSDEGVQRPDEGSSRRLTDSDTGRATPASPPAKDVGDQPEDVQSPIDAAANEAATSPKNGLPEPTPAQKEAGNYKVGRISLGGLDISIENPAGSERKGTDKDGKAWSVTMKSHYGYIRRTRGSDGDHVDVFVKPGTETLDADSPVFIIDQENADGTFDEHKTMLGFETQDEAEKAYLQNYTKGWKIGPVTATKLRGFKDWLNRGYTDEPASIDVNEVFWNPPPAEDFLDEYGEGRRLPETKEQIYKDLATRISVPKFVERLATDKGGMGAAFIEPSGKLYLIRGTDNQNGDHAEFFGRMIANDHITGKDDGYVRISSYSDYFGYSTGGDISQAAAATIKALETAAARAGINVIKPANDFKVIGEAQAAEPELPTPPAKIDDFGEKIAGARKDMVRDFKDALNADVDFQNEPLSKIFPQPDYEKLAESGIERRVLAVTALIRDEIPAKPRKGYKVDRWAKQVRTLRDFAAGLMSGRLSEEEFRRRLLDAPTLSNLANTADLIADLPLWKLSEAAKWRVRSGNYTIFEGIKLEGSTRLLTLSDADGRIVRDKDGRVISAKTFEELKAAAQPIMREALSDEAPTAKKRTPVAVYSDRTAKTIFIGFKGQSGVIRLKSGFENVKDARAYISENADEIQSTIDEMRSGFTMRREVNRPREGEARREGDVTPEQFQEAFGFRGVQFGNYVEDARRQFELNEAFDGLMDLAEVLRLPPRALSLNGTLGLAFGARGKGGPNSAKAHFEPDQIAINLTKAKGAGSLAHEWFHGLDNYFGRMDTSGNMAAMISKDKVRRGGTRDAIWSAWKAVADTLDQGSYATRMRKADDARSTPYWNTTVEKVARGFEKYVVDRLADKKASNDYLANIDENAGAYPTDQEMAEQGVTAALDNLFSTIETKVEDGGSVKMFEGRREGEQRVLEPKGDKRSDPEPIIIIDPVFRRIPVPARAPNVPLFRWAREAVLERGKKTNTEYLMAIDDDGTVVDFGTSDQPNFVGTNARLAKALANPDRRLVLVHNHPRNWPLSRADLSMLLHPGAYSIWAIGHDGLETRAALTEQARSAMTLGTSTADIGASIDRLDKALGDAERSIEVALIKNLDDLTIDISQAEKAHLMAIPEMARRAGIIDFTTSQPYDPSNIPMLDRAIDTAALKLARTLINERAAPQTSDARLLRQAVSVQHVGELETVAGDGPNVERRDEGQRGLREGGPRDYQAEERGRNARRLTGSRRISESSVVEAIKGKWTDLNPSVLATVPLNYFVELARPNMTAVKEYMSVKRLMDAYRGDKHAEADAIAGDWLKYMRLGFGRANKAKAQELADLMHESTLAGIDPSLTDEETKAKAGYDILRKRYQALSPTGKELFGKVRDAYRAQADELDQILLDNVRKSQQIAKDQAEARYKKKLEEIRDAKMNPIDRRKAEEDAASRYKSESTKMDWSAKARLTKLRIQFESNRVPAPYFPLGRFGQYYVTAKDVDGSVISFSKFERAADRDRFARDIQRDYPGATITKGVMKEMRDPRAAMDPRMVAEIEQLLGNAGVDQDLMDMVYQRYLETLPELSMRKRYMHRKGTAGYDTDALRVFSSHMFHAAHQMAKLKYGLELQELVNTTFDQAEAADDQTRAMRLANEMASRHKWVMNPTGGSVAQTMTSTAFVWFLAASPAAAVLNLTQTFMMGLPILGARFGGITQAGVEVAKASADLISGKGSVRNANLSREEMAAVDAFYRSGMIDRTQSHDLAGVGDTGVRYSPLRARVMGVMSWAFHNTEVWNREATALAAYRLARKSGQSHLEAIDSAHDLTWKTHFDYSNSSRPRIMQNDFAKVALVFRSYSINMLYRMFRDIHQSVKGESAQARREARYQLAGVTGMMTLMAGVTGTFGFNLMMAVAGMIFGDDDDPLDFEERFKADVLDILGPELGGVVLKGVPGHYLGVDLTSRIGMPDLWFRSPGQDLQGKEEWQFWLSQALGATAGIGEQWFRGASLVMEGDVARGLEVAAPKFIRDPMKAFRYANEGLQSIRGDELLPSEQIGIHGAVAQAMGISPAVVSETWERAGALKNAEQRVMDERQRIVNAWAMAAIAGDKEGVAEAIERVKAFNKKPVHSAIPITSDTLKRSIKTRQRNAAKREDGVVIQNEILSQRLRAAMPARIY